MLKDAILQDFELDSKVFNMDVQDGKAVDVFEPEHILNITNVAVVADGNEKWVDATGFFEVVDIEISDHIFKDVPKAVVPVHIYAIEPYAFNNIMGSRPGDEINLKAKANIGLPKETRVENIVVVVELTAVFFEVIGREFAGTEAEAKLARKVFKTAQAKYVPPEITEEVAKTTGEAIGITWEGSPFDVTQFKNGMTVELEHGLVDPQTNVTDDDLEMTGKIALAHLKERADYYVKLAEMEKSPVEDVKPS